MATEIDIANLALSHVGSSNRITALDGVGSEENRQCFLHYVPARNAMLAAHPWNFAIKRTTLITQAESAKSVTGATAANPVVLTVTAHGYSDGDRVRPSAVGGMTQINDREFIIDVLTANTFSLLGENGASHTAYTSGGTVTKIPGSEYSYWFALPTDCLRVIWADRDEYDYKVEGGRVLSNSDSVQLRYIAKITDPALFDDQFVQVLSLALAIRISVKLSDNANLKEALRTDFEAVLRDARTFDAQGGGTPDNFDTDAWLRARL